MQKFTLLFFFLLILFLFGIINADKGSIDLSDKNPVVYCLKSAKKYNMDQVKEYLLKSQIPEYKEELKINDDMFSWCIEELSRDN